MRRLALALLLVLPGCCSSCGCGSAVPRAEGPTPYARCALADPPEARELTVGALGLTIRDRDLTITGAPDPLRIAAFRGPAPAHDPIATPIELGGADLAIVLGSIGDDPVSATASLVALSSSRVPLLVLAGGRDDPAHLAAALEALTAQARDRVIDVSALRTIHVGGAVLVPIAGAPEGRYARTDDACGIGQSDLDEIAGELGAREDGPPRILLSWAAPAAIGLEGGQAGSTAIAALAERIGAELGVHAWPDGRAGEMVGPHAFVPAIAGPATVRGFLLFELSRGTLRLAPSTAPPSAPVPLPALPGG
jgi:hypothetical protein